MLFTLFICSCNIKQAYPVLWPSPTPTLSPELMDRSWLTDQPCRAPCWYGLTLGASNMSDAREMASQLSFIDKNNMEETNEAYFDPISEDVFKADVLLYHCKEPKDSICSQLSFVNDKLVSISLYINYKISLSEVVEKIGAPDFLSYAPLTIHTNLWHNGCFIEFLWVERQMILRNYNNKDDVCDVFEKNGYKPSPNLPIHHLWYSMPEFFSDLNVDKGYFPWVGFAEEK